MADKSPYDFLIKFVRPEYAEDMRHGNIFCSNISHFWENHDGDESGIYDPDEGFKIIEEVLKDRYFFYEDEKTFEVTSIKRRSKSDLTNHVAISSFVYYSYSSDFVTNPDGKRYLRPELLNGLREEFSDNRIAFIMFRGEVERMLINYFNARTDHKIIKLVSRPVEYYESSNTGGSDETWTVDQVMDFCFKKKSKYSNQHEYRIAVLLDNNDKHLTITGADFPRIELKSFDQLTKLHQFQSE